MGYGIENIREKEEEIKLFVNISAIFLNIYLDAQSNQ